MEQQYNESIITLPLDQDAANRYAYNASKQQACSLEIGLRGLGTTMSEGIKTEEILGWKKCKQ